MNGHVSTIISKARTGDTGSVIIIAVAVVFSIAAFITVFFTNVVVKKRKMP